MSPLSKCSLIMKIGLHPEDSSPTSTPAGHREALEKSVGGAAENTLCPCLEVIGLQ